MQRTITLLRGESTEAIGLSPVYAGKCSWSSAVTAGELK